MAAIFSIVYQPEGQLYDERFDYFIRVPVDQVTLVANYGIHGDKKAGRNPKRQLNLLSYDWLMARQQEGYKIASGSFGEQLVVQGLDVQALDKGLRLQLGNTAIIEITFPRTGCIRLDAAQKAEAVFDGAEIGMMAKVISGGVIKVGDPVVILTD